MLLKQQQKKYSSRVKSSNSYHWHVAQISARVVRFKFNYESSPSTTHSSFQIIAVYFASLRCHLMIMFEAFFFSSLASRLEISALVIASIPSNLFLQVKRLSESILAQSRRETINICRRRRQFAGQTVSSRN